MIDLATYEPRADKKNSPPLRTIFLGFTNAVISPV